MTAHKGILGLLLLVFDCGVFAQSCPQWGEEPQPAAFFTVGGQSASQKVASLTFDPFVAQEAAEGGGALLVRYQTPLTDGQDVFIESRSGQYVSCNPPGSYTPFPCGTDNW